MTGAEGTPDANPAESSGGNPPNQADPVLSLLRDTNNALSDTNVQVIGILSSIAAQVNWICQVITMLTQSMPPFMRGAVNVPANPYPFPGQSPYSSGQ